VADIKFKVKQITNNIAPKMSRIGKRLDTVAPKGYKFFKSITPIRTGNARRRTRLQGQTIKGAYDYASRLDEGYSRQAPLGMSGPTLEYLQKLVQNIFRRS